MNKLVQQHTEHLNKSQRHFREILLHLKPLNILSLFCKNVKINTKGNGVDPTGQQSQGAAIILCKFKWQGSILLFAKFTLYLW